MPGSLRKICGWVVVVVGRAGNSGGTREPSSQKEFGFAESFFGFEIFTKFNSNMFLKFLPKLFVLHRKYQFCDISMISSAGIH